MADKILRRVECIDKTLGRTKCIIDALRKIAETVMEADCFFIKAPLLLLNRVINIVYF